MMTEPEHFTGSMLAVLSVAIQRILPPRGTAMTIGKSGLIQDSKSGAHRISTRAYRHTHIQFAR